MLGVNADHAEEYRERRGEQQPGVLERVAQREYARADVALEMVHQRLYVPAHAIIYYSNELFLVVLARTSNRCCFSLSH